MPDEDKKPPTEGDATATEAAKPKLSTTATHPTHLLTRPTDAAARPGFRSPPNARTKAQKNRKK